MSLKYFTIKNKKRFGVVLKGTTHSAWQSITNLGITLFLTTPNQNKKFSFPKIKIIHLTLSTEAAEKRILQFDWLRLISQYRNHCKPFVLVSQTCVFLSKLLSTLIYQSDSLQVSLKILHKLRQTWPTHLKTRDTADQRIYHFKWLRFHLNQNVTAWNWSHIQSAQKIVDHKNFHLRSHFRHFLANNGQTRFP